VSPKPASTARPPLYPRVVTTIAALCIMLVGVSFAMIWHSRTESIKGAASEADRLAISLAQQATDALTIDETALDDLVQRIELDGTSPLQLRRLHRIAVSNVANIPSLHGLFVIDRHGRPVATALTVTPKRLNYRDVDDFRFAATHASTQFHIGPAIRSRNDGSWIFTITRRLNDSHGGFAGIAACTISVRYFEKLYGSIQLEQTGIIDLLRDDGVVLVRAPFNARYLGVSTAKSDLFQTYLAHAAAGNFVGRSFLDDVRRVHAYRRLERFPIVILIGLPEADILARWRADAVMKLAVVLVLVLTISILGVYLGVEVRKGQRMEYELAQLAFRDGLTGVANRRCFDDAFAREWRRAARDGSALSLLMIDVDHFKHFNDTYGHQRGDEVLKNIARCVSAALKRPGDIVARYGGEEFSLLLPATNATGALALAENVRQAVSDLAIPSNIAAGRVTVSVGAATAIPNADDDPDALIGAADAALYKAKGYGRNRTVVSVFGSCPT
jgi:diguanylate cyclase (GGDEF)-like protein